MMSNTWSFPPIGVSCPAASFNEHARWTIDLGTLQVDGQTVKIAPLALCFHPRKAWLGVEPLMRP